MGRVVMNKSFKREMGTPPNCSRWQEEVAQQGAVAISLHAPEDTGALRERIEGTPHRTQPSVRFRAHSPDPDTPYPLWQDIGTGLYGPLKRYITPTQAKMLSWIDRATGNRRFARRVRGTPATHYFREGLLSLFTKVRYYGDRGGRGAQKG